MTLKELRKDLGFTQAEVARRVGVDKRVYRRWENAERAIPSGRLFSLANIFGISVGEVLESWAEMDSVDATELRRG